ncbi:sensor histidine kinase, partial [Klebsiella pneumoniae]|uniref:sensor histidine kinase n=1 Tax=Klebsiella pneumoniae TaxID=573 RepID=UPI00236656BF
EDARGGMRLGVADSGPGIPAAERARVFDPFYRVLGTEQLGSGLGLSIVKAIAERLGATLDLTETDAARHRGLNIGVVLPARL